MLDPKKTLNEAKILIQTGNPEKITRAEELLQQIQQEHPGYATQASRLMANINKDISSSQPISRKAQELSQTWAGINSIEDGKLYKFLAKLFDLKLRQETAITNLRRQVVKQLSKWIGQINDNEWLNSLIEPIKQHPEFNHQLDDALNTLRQTQLSDKYKAIATKVNDALTNWAVEEASQSLSTLPPSLPVTLQNQVTQLQQNINDVENDIQRLETLLTEISTPPFTDWAQLQKQIKQRQKLQTFQVKSNYVTPADWQAKIEAKLQEFSTHIQEFLKNKAQTCHSLAAVHEFYREFNRLDLNDVDLEIKWFEHAQNAFQTENDNELKKAASPQELEQIHQRLSAEKASLPAWLADWLQNRADAVSALIKQWPTIKTGADFVSDVNSSVALPDAFQQQLGEYQQLWQNLQKIEQQIDLKNAPTDNDFKKATKDLEFLSTNRPEHQFLQKLLALAETNRQHSRFDTALEQWDIDHFLEICRAATPSETVLPYLQLAESETESGLLETLKKLDEAPKFSNSQQATVWWQDWHTAISQLPEKREWPDQFSQQLEKIATERKRAWFEILDALLCDPQSTAPVYDETANTLENWRNSADANFIKYYNNLKRLAWQKHATECMAAKNWQGAQDALAQFKNAGGDNKTLERLNVLLNVRQAEAESLNKLADVLWEQWHLINTYLPYEIGGFLYNTIRFSWQNNDTVRLSTLRQLARGLSPEQRTAPLLTLWLDWLEIEQALAAPEISQKTLSKFVKLVFTDNGHAIPDELRPPLKRLLSHWQTPPIDKEERQNKRGKILYAWFYNACHRVQPPLILEAVEPLTQLTQQSEQTAARTKNDLAQLTNISDTDITDAQTTLQSEVALWQRLADYSKLLPFPPAHQPRAPNSLDETNALVEKLAQVKQQLVELEDADLREAQHNRQLINIQGFIKKELHAFVVCDTWLSRANALEPLTRLAFSLSQFKKATCCFGSDGSDNDGCDELDPLNKRDLLVTMGKYSLELIQRFEHANVVERGMWQRVSEECWTLVCQEGGVLLPVPDKPDLQELRDLLPTLNDEEQKFRQALTKLANEASQTHVPAGAEINVNKDKYQAFFAAFPEHPPRTRRSYRLFDKEIRKEPMATLLTQQHSQSKLPDWVNKAIGNE
ncbi:MAG: hypothetical protein DRR08_16170 [Candidatus Parabeggiatoa sp. nov. 2]|nr:MAG: hypothetical protein B6247_14780 [Beggiatoa sp. 4572_84]RKZ58545.1 MAG: hypothetical protein DRR08_16170 [Gammaproteobacteria bacterium]